MSDVAIPLQSISIGIDNTPLRSSSSNEGPLYLAGRKMLRHLPCPSITGQQSAKLFVSLMRILNSPEGGSAGLLDDPFLNGVPGWPRILRSKLKRQYGRSLWWFSKRKNSTFKAQRFMTLTHSSNSSFMIFYTTPCKKMRDIKKLQMMPQTDSLTGGVQGRRHLFFDQGP